jgi:hypothetical protein
LPAGQEALQALTAGPWVAFSSKGLPLGTASVKQQIEEQLQIKPGTGKAGRPGKTELIGSDPFCYHSNHSSQMRTQSA